MSNLVKKVTSVVLASAVVLTAVSTTAGVSAAYTNLEAANKLANLDVIVDKSTNPSAYGLANKVRRDEALKVMMKLSGKAVSEGACTSPFADIADSHWACKYAVAALDNNFIAANDNYRPADEVSNSEALKMVMQARGIAKTAGVEPWQAAYVDAAVNEGIAQAFSDYNTAADRGTMFVWAAEAVAPMMVEEDDDDLLGSLLDGLTDDEPVVDEPVVDTPVVTGDDVLTVSLSPATPASATVPASVNGLPAAKFDFTAGNSDVTISQVTITRRGLSDDDTLDKLAVFTDEGRASNDKDDNQENDTEAQINLSNGGLVIEAGMTKTMTIVVDLGTSAVAANDEFALELTNIVASSDVDSSSSLVSNTMRIGSVDAPTVTIKTGSNVSDPKLGDEGVDIFEFEVEGDNNEDVILKSITFEGSNNAEDDLMNFELELDGSVIATATAMNDDYLTFNLGEGVVIAEDKTEDFTVTADVIEGASDAITFNVDEALDVTAESTKFGFGAKVDITAVTGSNNFGTVTIEAGELTLVEVEAAFDEVREDKDNVVLGGLKVTNVAGQNLELQEFGVLITLTPGNAELPGNANGSLTVQELFSDVELYNEDSGSSYELSLDGTPSTSEVASENSIDVTIPQGTTNWSIRADTANDIDDFDSASFSLSFTTGKISNTTGGFYAEETQDDEPVTDITPSSISFNSIDGSESGAKVSLIPLSDTDVVRGADDIVAIEFEIEADESSDVFLDEVVANVAAASVAFSSSNKPNQSIAAVKLFQGDTEIDQESGSNIADDGTISFNDFSEITINANETQTFSITISVVDAASAVTNGNLSVDLTSLDVTDDENDDVTVTGGLPLSSARDISVNSTGKIITTYLDDANADNEFDKQALAGEQIVLGSVDVRADNEEVEVETVVFTIAGAAASLANSVVNATLLLDGEEIGSTGTNANSDITDTTITFEDVQGLVLPETTSELALRLNTANIGEDFVGQVQTGISIASVTFSDAKGTESGKDLAPADIVAFAGDPAKTLDIVTAVVTPAVASTFGTDDQTAEVQLVVDAGNNTDTSGDTVQADLAGLTFEITSNTSAAAGTITVFNSNGTQVGSVAVAAATNGSFTVGRNSAGVGTALTDSIGNADETYRVETSVEGIIRLAKDGVVYTVDGGTSFLSTKLENTLEIGQYADSN